MPNSGKRKQAQQKEHSIEKALFMSQRKQSLFDKFKLYFKKHKLHRLYPFLTTASGIWGSMLISKEFGAVCLILTAYLILVIFIPWEKVKSYQLISQYGGTLLICLAIAIPNWGWIISRFPQQILIEQKQPIVYNASQIVHVWVGGFVLTHTLGELNKEVQYFKIDTDTIIQVSAVDSTLKFDVNMYDKESNPTLEIVKNGIIVPQNWDYNYDNTHVEVINNLSIPVFQMVYVEPYEVVIKGVFPVGGTAFISDDLGVHQTPPTNTSPKSYTITQIFKYPSANNLGKLSFLGEKIWIIQ